MTTACTEPTTFEYMAYHAGFAAGQKEVHELKEPTIRQMHAALCRALDDPTPYPAGISGPDRYHRKGRRDAYAYWLKDKPAQPSLLSLIRQLRDAIRAYDAALHACDNHEQAGYDTGYRDEFIRQGDDLRAIYYACSDELDRLQILIFNRFEQPNNSMQWLDYDRACRIARKYA